MCGLFRNKYRTGSVRYCGYDYSLPGTYYVTICTKNKTHYFGEVENGKIKFSEIGLIARQMLTEIPVHFPFARLDEFVVMPNHIHAIIVINELQKNQNIFGQNGDSIESSSCDNSSLTGIVEPLHATALRQPSRNIIDMDENPFINIIDVGKNPSTNNLSGDNEPCTNSPGKTKNIHMSSISPSSGSLATIVRSFKSAVTKTIHITNLDFEWQKSFYDHIIRTGIELSRIRNYIKSNPEKWNSK